MEREKFLLGVVEEFVVEVMVHHNWEVLAVGTTKYQWVNHIEGKAQQEVPFFHLLEDRLRVKREEAKKKKAARKSADDLRDMFRK